MQMRMLADVECSAVRDVLESVPTGSGPVTRYLPISGEKAAVGGGRMS